MSAELLPPAPAGMKWVVYRSILSVSLDRPYVTIGLFRDTTQVRLRNGWREGLIIPPIAEVTLPAWELQRPRRLRRAVRTVLRKYRKYLRQERAVLGLLEEANGQHP
jgi:hypothetical protein